MQIWDHVKLEEGDQEFWDDARIQAPSFALFRRLELSAEDRTAQDATFRETAEGLENWFSRADKVEISESEIGTSFSLAYNSTKDGESSTKKPWWRRWFHPASDDT
jgi:hypothetical protein